MRRGWGASASAAQRADDNPEVACVRACVRLCAFVCGGRTNTSYFAELEKQQTDADRSSSETATESELVEPERRREGEEESEEEEETGEDWWGGALAGELYKKRGGREGAAAETEQELPLLVNKRVKQ